MKKVVAGLMVALTFALMFGFAIFQVMAWTNYGAVLGILAWIPFLLALWVLSKIVPEDWYY